MLRPFFAIKKYKFNQKSIIMRKTAKEIIADVEEHLTKSNKRYYSDFYVGITNDIERRLFTEHNVNKKTTGGFIVPQRTKLSRRVLKNIF
jgi:hypothetical protein